MNGFKKNPWYFHRRMTDCVGVRWVNTQRQMTVVFVSGPIDCVEIFEHVTRADSRHQHSSFFFPLSLLTAALSSLQLPLSLYLLTHLSRGEVVTQHEGVVSFPLLFFLYFFYFILYFFCCFLCLPSSLLSFTACSLLYRINHFSLWWRFGDLWSSSMSSLIILFFLWNWHLNRRRTKTYG